MVESPVTDALSAEERLVVGWRFDRLIGLGLDETAAEFHAMGDLDIHELERITGCGCDLRLAVEILA